jgi:hypothetical protein
MMFPSYHVLASTRGAQPVTAFPKSVLNKTDVAAAIKEYVEDSETESEAENGADDE